MLFSEYVKEILEQYNKIINPNLELNSHMKKYFSQANKKMIDPKLSYEFCQEEVRKLDEK
jgi:hypothetical protein